MSIMARMRLIAAVTLLAATALALPGAAQRAAAPTTVSARLTPLTIDQLIDIRHPSNPVWSRDSRRIAFTWERAGGAEPSAAAT
jgi:hypothetical protein